MQRITNVYNNSIEQIVYKHNKSMNTKRPKLKKIVSPAATLRGMKAGTSVKIPTRYIKSPSLRTTATRLKKHGYAFHVTEAGLVNETLITCIKSPVK